MTASAELNIFSFTKNIIIATQTKPITKPVSTFIVVNNLKRQFDLDCF